MFRISICPSSGGFVYRLFTAVCGVQHEPVKMADDVIHIVSHLDWLVLNTTCSSKQPVYKKLLKMDI